SVTVGVVDGRVTRTEPARSTLVADNVWLVPGFVDAHCHDGLEDDGAVDEARQRQQATEDRDGGTHAIRDCGVPADTRWIDAADDLPRIIRAGRHIARPKRHTRDIGLEVEPDELVATVEAEVPRGDGWIKLVGDWIDRDRGDIAPLWPFAELTAAIARAHELGARVTAHVFGEEALPDLIAAGIDCIEHGTGMSPDVIDAMAARRIALVPTLINIARFPEIAEKGHRFPVYADHMRSLHRTVYARVRDAYEAGVAIYSGTDAGSEVVHGRIADEVLALRGAGLSAADALGAASWRAREWLGVSDGLAEGSDANFVVYPADPLTDVTVLRHPKYVVLRGALFAR
ncbi:MAG TPA: amidohydrolase family protein, partial [Acidimicrobiales bacterium]|nr:amidohydrolase family protein [Acidimicrobiales bacterium]